MAMIHDWKNFKRQLEERKQSIQNQIDRVDWVIQVYEDAIKTKQQYAQLVEFMRDRVVRTSKLNVELPERKLPPQTYQLPPGGITRREGAIFTGPQPAPKYFKDGTEAAPAPQAKRQPYGHEGDKSCIKCGANLRAKKEGHICSPNVTGARYECKDCGTMAPRGGFHSCNPKYKEWKCPKCGRLATNKDIHFCGVGDNDPGNNAKSFRVRFDEPKSAERKLQCPICMTYFGGGQVHICESGKIFIDKGTDPKCPFCQKNLTGIDSHICEAGAALMSDAINGAFGQNIIDKEADEKNFEIMDPEDYEGIS